MELPADSIRVYNTSGILQGKLVYTDKGVTFVPHPQYQSPETATSPQQTTENTAEPPTRSPLYPMESLQMSDFEDHILPLTSQAMEEQMITNSIDPDVEDGENHQTTATTTYSSGLATNVALTSSIICSTSDSGPDSNQIEDNHEIHITDLEAESNIKSTHSSCLQTSLASAIAKALGHDREITEFDKLRHQLKEAKKHKKQLPGYKQLTDQHEKFLTLFGTRLLKHKSKLQQSIRQLEQDCFNSHGCLPKAEKDSRYAKLIKKMNEAKTLLRHLNIML